MMLQSFIRDSLHILPVILLFAVIFSISINTFMTYTPADETKTTVFNVGVQKAYGDIDRYGEYFCNIEIPELEKIMYEDRIERINNGIQSVVERGASDEKKFGVIEHNKEVDKIAKCLKETLNIDPYTVAQLNYISKKYILNNLDQVNEITPHLVEYADLSNTKTSTTSVKPKTSEGGCLIATAAYGSELAPQIQTLREIRDSTLMLTESGSAFMSAFNTAYYAFSPVVADWERQNSLFAEAVRTAITPMIWSLSIMSNIDGTEESVLAYGISVLALNVSMYLIIPILATLTVVKFITKRRTIQTLS